MHPAVRNQALALTISQRVEPPEHSAPFCALSLLHKKQAGSADHLNGLIKQIPIVKKG
jgi:hypothetical protein